jgi:hypothetical protein
MKYKMLLAAGCLLLMLTGYMLWAKPFSYMPSPQALESIGEGQGAQTIDLGWDGTCYVFLPDRNKEKKKGFILYPGGLVDARAYAPLMQAIAAEGYLAIIASMPCDLAVFGYKRAGAIMGRNPGIEKWALAGHSLGGVMACRYVRSENAKISGLILLASYPSDRYRIDQLPLKALSIFGTRDGLTKLSDIEASKQHLPAGTKFVEIQGGNHSQFCSLTAHDQLYRGDNTASIPYSQQQQAVIGAMVDFLNSL